MNRLTSAVTAALMALAVGAGGGWYVGNATAPKMLVVGEVKPILSEHAVSTRVVNLANWGARRCLKLSMVLQVQEPSVEHAGAATHVGELPNLRGVHDALTTVLSAKRSEDTLPTSGKERLKDELELALNRVLPPDHQVARVFFTDFILQ